MSCSDAEVSAVKSSACSGWFITLKEGECAGATWPFACELLQVGIDDDDSESGTIEDGQCIAWKYLDAIDCPQIQGVDTGRWWVFGRSGLISTADYTFADSRQTRNKSLSSARSSSIHRSDRLLIIDISSQSTSVSRHHTNCNPSKRTSSSRLRSRSANMGRTRRALYLCRLLIISGLQ